MRFVSFPSIRIAWQSIKYKTAVTLTSELNGTEKIFEENLIPSIIIITLLLLYLVILDSSQFICLTEFSVLFSSFFLLLLPYFCVFSVIVCLYLVFEWRMHRIIYVLDIGLITIENIYAFSFTVNTKYTTKNKLCYNRDYYYGWLVSLVWLVFSVAMAHAPILNRVRRYTIYVIENENERKTKPVFKSNVRYIFCIHIT